MLDNKGTVVLHSELTVRLSSSSTYSGSTPIAVATKMSRVSVWLLSGTTFVQGNSLSKSQTANYCLFRNHSSISMFPILVMMYTKSDYPWSNPFSVNLHNSTVFFSNLSQIVGNPLRTLIYTYSLYTLKISLCKIKC